VAVMHDENTGVYNKLILAIESSLRIEEADTERDIQFWGNLESIRGFDMELRDICLDVYRVLKQAREQVEGLMQSFPDTKVDAPSIYRLVLEVLAKETARRVGRLEKMRENNLSQETREHIISVLAQGRDLLSVLNEARDKAAAIEEVLTRRKRGEQ